MEFGNYLNVVEREVKKSKLAHQFPACMTGGWCCQSQQQGCHEKKRILFYYYHRRNDEFGFRHFEFEVSLNTQTDPSTRWLEKWTCKQGKDGIRYGDLGALHRDVRRQKNPRDRITENITKHNSMGSKGKQSSKGGQEGSENSGL